MATAAQRARANKHPLPAAERALIVDRLKLALDEVETGPGDFDSVRRAVKYQREAIQVSHRRYSRMLGGDL